eukprot:6211937-Pleurochrysis_carterae.AAC.1
MMLASLLLVFAGCCDEERTLVDTHSSDLHVHPSSACNNVIDALYGCAISCSTHIGVPRCDRPFIGVPPHSRPSKRCLPNSGLHDPSPLLIDPLLTVLLLLATLQEPLRYPGYRTTRLARNLEWSIP